MSLIFSHSLKGPSLLEILFRIFIYIISKKKSKNNINKKYHIHMIKSLTALFISQISLWQNKH